MTTTIWSRIQERIAVDAGGCWIWQGSTNSKGYGLISSGGRVFLVHRVALLARDGAIEPGYVADHTCHDPATCAGGSTCHHRLCVNPAHLEAVTIAENSRRGAQQKRGTCKAGHRLTFRRRGTKLVRCCRQCESVSRTRTAVPA